MVYLKRRQGRVVVLVGEESRSYGAMCATNEGTAKLAGLCIVRSVSEHIIFREESREVLTRIDYLAKGHIRIGPVRRCGWWVDALHSLSGDIAVQSKVEVI